MEILITADALTVFDEHGQSFAERRLELMTADLVWAVVLAVRRDKRHLVEQLLLPTASWPRC